MKEENLIPETKVDLIGRKKEHWKTLKDEYLKRFRNDYPLEMDWGYKENIYYHPIVHLTDNISVYAQCDLNNNDRVYGIDVRLKGSGGNNTIYFDDRFTLDYLLDNLDVLDEKLHETFSICKKIDLTCQELERQKRKVLQYTMTSYMDKIEKRKFVREFEDVLEFIESIRLTY